MDREQIEKAAYMALLEMLGVFGLAVTIAGVAIWAIS